MKVIVKYMSNSRATALMQDNEILFSENGYVKALDLFDGQSYWLKGVDEIGRTNGAKYILDKIVKVSVVGGKTYVDGELFEELRGRAEASMESWNGTAGALERNDFIKYMLLSTLNLRMIEDSEIVVAAKGEPEQRVKPSQYKYKPRVAVEIGGTKKYAKGEPQGREYHKQADEWVVRAHYRVRNGVKYLVKGYKKMFKGEINE